MYMYIQIVPSFGGYVSSVLVCELEAIHSNHFDVLKICSGSCNYTVFLYYVIMIIILSGMLC